MLHSSLPSVLVLLLGVLFSTNARALAPAEVFRRAAPATVVIIVEGDGASSLGTGAIVSPSGLVVTNYHVIAPLSRSRRVSAFLFSATERRSEERLEDFLRTHRERARPLVPLRVDPERDLAVLALPTGVSYPSLPLGDSDRVRTGQSVLAIGAPLGLTWTLTPGLISALRASTIQTSAPINPGNSGGPLLDLQGRLIGINTYIRDGQGLGFARPVNVVRALLRDAASAGSPPLLASEEPAAPWQPGQRLAQVLRDLATRLVATTAVSGAGFDQGVSLLAAFLTEEHEAAFTRTLHAGVPYTFVAGGESAGADTDVDLLIRDASGAEVAAALEEDAAPRLRFTPGETGRYTIALRVARAAPGGIYAALAVLREGGAAVRAEGLAAAIQRVVQAGEATDRQLGARYHDAEDQWCLFGAVLAQGEDLALPLALESGRHAALAAAEDPAEDIDLALQAQDGAVVAADQATDANPFVSARTDGRPLRLQVHNHRSAAAVLVLTTLLDVGDGD